MKLGKVSQTVYKRSILKQLHTDKAQIQKPAQYDNCCVVFEGEDEYIMTSEINLYGNEKDLCVFAIAQAANQLAIHGAVPRTVSMQIMLPDFAFESRLKAMIAAAKDAAEANEMTILSADASVVPHIQTTIVHVTVSGAVQKERFIQGCDAKSDQDIVLLKYIGTEGMLRIKREKESVLSERFTPAFINQMEAYSKDLFSVAAVKAATAIGVSAMHQIGEGGIMAALWNLAEESGIGLSADMRKIAIRQETIEVCELFHLNPYQLSSCGSILVVSPRGEELADTLSRNGIPAVVIGHTTKGNEKVLYSGEEKRYLDRPAPDEIHQIYKAQEEKKSILSED